MLLVVCSVLKTFPIIIAIVRFIVILCLYEKFNHTKMVTFSRQGKRLCN